jgi:hypothetical protein
MGKEYRLASVRKIRTPGPARTRKPSKGHQVGYLRVSALDQNDARQLEGLVLDKKFTDKGTFFVCNYASVGDQDAELPFSVSVSLPRRDDVTALLVLSIPASRRARLSRMPLIIILIILLVLFGGGGYYMGPGIGYYGGGGLSLILALVIIYLLFGRGRSRL